MYFNNLFIINKLDVSLDPMLVVHRIAAYAWAVREAVGEVVFGGSWGATENPDSWSGYRC